MDWTETLPPWIVFAAVTLAGLLLVLILALAVRRRIGDSFPYTLQPVVLSPEENTLREVLQQAIGDRALLLPKLRVSEALGVRRNLSRRRATRAQERIAVDAFDFVLCAPSDTRPLVAIALDRAQGAEQRRRDRFLDEACRAAGLGLLRVPPSDEYAAADLREQLRPHLERSEAFRVGDVTADGRREPILDLPVE